MELLTEILYSNKDKSTGIVLPTYLNEDLAEFIGIVIGDDHLEYEERKDSKFYSIRISFNLTEDIKYFESVVNPLFRLLFNAKLSIITSKKKNYFIGVKCSKAIVNFLKINFSIPIGNKTSNISIPNNISNSDRNIQAAFIRGLADTDFSLSFKKKKIYHDYPVIKGSLQSKVLIQQLNDILTKLGFTPYLILYERNMDKRFNKNYERHSIYLSGKENLEKWISLIGFNNHRLFTKYLIWKKLGFCQPNTSLKERYEILAGKVDPHKYYNGPARI